MRFGRRVIHSLVALSAPLLTACGATRSPTSPPEVINTAPAPLEKPLSFKIDSQTLRLAGNSITLSWSSPAGQTGAGYSWHLDIGTASGLSNIQSVDLTSQSYTWTNVVPGAYVARVAAKRAGELGPYTSDLPITAVDLRHVIDAMLFWCGPYSDFGTVVNSRLSVWPDGTQVTYLTSPDIDEPTKTAAAAFAASYASHWSSTISAATVPTTDRMTDWDVTRVSPTTVAMRVNSTACPAGSGACNTGGPPNASTSVGKSLLTFTAAGQISVAGHELGHAYGFGHVRFPQSAATYGLALPMMGPSAGAPVPTDYEAEALRAVRAAGFRGGSTRNEALAAGLVKATTSGTTPTASGVRGGGW